MHWAGVYCVCVLGGSYHIITSVLFLASVGNSLSVQQAYYTLHRYIHERFGERAVSSLDDVCLLSPGGSILNHTFLWRLPDDFTLEAVLSTNQQVVAKLTTNLPVYHTREMKREFVSHYGLLMAGVKPYVLRSLYHELTNDASGSRTSEEADIDERVKEALAAEDLDVIIDLREMNEGRVGKYDIFWEKCTEYIAECTERRHGEVCFMAKALSVRDLVNQVSKRCPPVVPIPSESWVRLNFAPRNPRAKVAERYCGQCKSAFSGKVTLMNITVLPSFVTSVSLQ